MIRPPTDQEKAILLDGDDGFLCESDGVVVGKIAYRLLIGYTPDFPEFFIRDLAVFSDDPTVAARLIQAVAKHAKALGYSNCLFHVTADNPSMLRLLDSPRASIDSYFVRINT